MTLSLTLGIDATNLRGGGGRTHLIELLRAAKPAEHGIGEVIVWGAQETLDLLPERHWLRKVSVLGLERGSLRRALWQRFALSSAARTAACDVLFIPGGSYAGDFHPVVTMSRNMLPFEWRELRRYGWSLTATKLLLLRVTQSRSFNLADGVVFLTHYARESVESVIGKYPGLTETIPHGVNSRFIHQPKLQRPITEYSVKQPYRVLYVSIIDQYKHQWNVVDAVGILRQETGWPIILDLVGPAYPPALDRLNAAINKWGSKVLWVNYHGAVVYDDLHRIYGQSDLGLFASSCENMPNILVETMAAGLPVACSSRGPMPELLGDAGVYFDPESPRDICSALKKMIVSNELRMALSKASFAASKDYTWERCANQTFAFLASVHQAYKKKQATCVV